MGFKALTINTSADAVPHITAEDDASLYGGIVGASGILNTGGCMAATVTDSNTITVTDGVVVVAGRYGRIPEGDSEVFTIESGVSGKKRNDLIVVRYATSGSTESLTMELIEGTAGDSAVDPATTAGDTILYRIKMDGYDVSVERVIPLVDGLYGIGESISEIRDEMSNKIGNLTIRKGMTVVTIPTGRTSVAFLDGVDKSRNPVILATNGNADANKAHICGVSIQGNKAYAVMEEGTIQYGLIQINYVFIQ